MQIVFLNTLTSEFIKLDNPLPNDEKVCGLYMLNASLFVYGHKTWCRFNLRGGLEETKTNSENDGEWKIFKMEWKNLDEYKMFFWTGDLDKPQMKLIHINLDGGLNPFYFHRYTEFQKAKKGENISICFFY